MKAASSTEYHKEGVMAIATNPAEETREVTLRMSEEEAGHLKAAVLICRDRATAAQEWGVATQYQILLERLERA